MSTRVTEAAGCLGAKATCVRYHHMNKPGPTADVYQPGSVRDACATRPTHSDCIGISFAPGRPAGLLLETFHFARELGLVPMPAQMSASR
jgi:hypothetical protein